MRSEYHKMNGDRSKVKRRLCISLCCILACSLFALTPSFCVAADNAPKADTIYFNGKIITMWDQHPNVQAVAIHGDRFLAVGKNADVLRTAGPGTKKIDLHGQSVIPGLISGHVHPIDAALSEIDGPLPPFNSVAEIQAYIREQARKLPPGQIIRVPTVFATRVAERRYPTRQEIDAAAGGRGAVVGNGYASVLDSVLLKRLGITRDTPQPAKGRIVKDRNGDPTGLILGAEDLLDKVVPPMPVTPKERLWALKSMLKHYNAVGLTGIDDRLEGPAAFRAYQTLHDAGELTVRCYVTYFIDAQGTPADVRKQIDQIPFVTGWGDKWFRVGSLKTVIDGGITIGTAYLRQPYGRHTQVYGFEGEPGYRGILYVPRENVFAMAQEADKLGWQMTSHVTGGGSLDILLAAYQAANRTQSIIGRRWVVTHGNFPDAHDIEIAKKLGIAFDVQPAWLYFDGPALETVLGPERIKNFLPLRSLMDAGVVVGGGSDHMTRFDPKLSTNPYDPFFEMWMAITRKMPNGQVLHPEQRITRFQALKMWTLNNAYMEFFEKETGSIEPGKLADMVVIDKNFATCPVDEIKDIMPEQTIVGGKVVYRRKSATM